MVAVPAVGYCVVAGSYSLTRAAKTRQNRQKAENKSRHSSEDETTVIRPGLEIAQIVSQP